MIQDLAFDVDLNLQCANGYTALHSAAGGSSTSAVVKLLQTDIDRKIRDNRGNLALHVAAQIGHLQVVKLLLADGRNSKGYNDLTPLHYATIYGHGEIVELLEGADLEAKDNKFGWMPLHCAVDHGDFQIVRLLIQRGADVNAVVDRTWWTPLHIAMIHGHTGIISLLLDKGASIALDKHGWLLHHFGQVNGHEEALMLLPEKDVATALSGHKQSTGPIKAFGRRGYRYLCQTNMEKLVENAICGRERS